MKTNSTTINRFSIENWKPKTKKLKWLYLLFLLLMIYHNGYAQSLQAVNDAIPNCSGGSLTISKSTLTANDLNPGNVPIYMDVAQPAHGTVVDNGTTITYTPQVGYAGADQFNYTIKNNDGTITFSGNGHVYEWVSSANISWSDARNAASGRTYNGMQGYLVTITSAAEMGFVSSKLQGNGWMGASDIASEGVWRWVTGPEGLENSGQGRNFSTQSWSGWCSAGTGVALGGNYVNWAGGEPNNCGGNYPESNPTSSTRTGEHYAHFWGAAGWNDWPNVVGGNNILGYIVEYGGLEPNTNATSTATVFINQLDSDGDGIADACDMDDDNDGIADLAECNKSNFFWSNPPSVSGNTATGTINGITYTYTSSQPVSTTTNVFAHHEFPASYQVPNVNPTIQNIQASNNTLTFASPMTNPILVFASIGGGPLSVPITFGAPVEVLWSKNVTINSSTQITGQEGYAIVRMNGTFSSISFNYLAYENWCNFAFGADVQTCGDTDSDGTPDYLDADSDNDGCYDALEGSASFNMTQIVSGKLTGAVGSNGIPLLAGVGQGIGTSQTNTANCLCESGNDQVAPVVKTKTNIFINLGPTGVAAVTVPLIDSVSTDACGIASKVVSPTSFTCTDVGAKTVTLTVTDINGNVSTGTASVYVIDNISPNVVIQPVTVYLDANGVASVTATQVNNGSSDECGIASMMLDKTSFTCANAATSNSGVLTVKTSVDNEYSAYISTDDNVQGTFVGSGNNWPTLTAYTANLVAGQTYYLHVYAQDWGGTEMMIGDFSVTGDFKFINGAQTMSTTAANWKVSGTGWSNYTQAVDVGPNGTSPWGNYPGVSSAARFIWRSPLNPSAADVAYFTTPIYYTGNNAVLFTATDNNGNGASALANITVLDTISPAIACPSNISMIASNAAGATVNYTTPSATDNCASATVTRIAGPASGSVFPIGITTVTHLATDPSGNTTMCSFTVNVTGLAPVIVNPGTISANTINGQCNATVTYSATETSGIPASTITYSIPSGSSFNVGTTSVTATATNAVGSSSATFNVIVTDNEMPVISAPANININIPSCETTASNITLGTPVTSDNCTVTVTNNAPATFSVGSTTVIWTAQDASGNTTTANQIVTITQSAALELNVVKDINCSGQNSGSIVVNATGGKAPLEYQLNSAAFQSGNSYSGLAPGVYSVTVKDADNCTVIQNQVTLTEPFCLQAVSDSFDNCAGNSITIQKSALLGNDANPWNVAVYMDVAQPANGTIVDNGASITYTPNANFTGIDQFNYTIKKDDGTITFAGNGHVYEWVPFYAITWNSARVAAGLRYYNGMQGYLVTVTSQSEMNFVTSKLQGSGWMGASDLAYEGVWRWVTGPEGLEESGQGRQFSGQNKYPSYWGNCAAATTSGLMGQYANWSGGEPNDCGAYLNQFSPTDLGRGGEHYAHFLGGGFWNDYSENVGGSIQGYIVEYGGLEGPSASAGTSTATVKIDTRKVIVSEVVTPATCAFAQDGSINLTVSGGTAPYTYNWGGGMTTQNVTGLAMGNYNVTVTDSKGCFSTQTIAVGMLDIIPPVAIANDITIALNASGTASITALQVDGGSSDACGIASMTLDNDLFNCSDVGPNTVILTVIDVNGNGSTAFATVTVQDITAPTALAQNVNLYLDAMGNASTTVADVNNGSFDNCGITSVNVSKTNFDCSNEGANEVTLTVMDVNGNSSTTTATVTVYDTISPIVAVNDLTVGLDANGNASINTMQINDGSTDNCAIASYSLNQTLFTCASIGANEVILTVTDVNGNSTTATATVTVLDQIVPTVLTQNVDVYLSATGTASTTAAAVDNGSFDNCSIASLSLSKTNFDCSNVGANEVTLTVTDVNGNVSNGTATVTVHDDVAPIVHTQNITVTLVSGVASITAAQINNGSTDNCSIASMSVSPSDFNCSTLGNNTVTLTVTDVNGNISSKTATVFVTGLIPTCTISSSPNNSGTVIGSTTSGAAVNQMYLGYGAQSMQLVCSPVGAAPFTYSWSGTGLSSSTIANPIFTPTAGGNFTFTCTITNAYGCQTTCNITICVIDARAPGSNANNPKVILCHVPPGNPNNPQSLNISVNAVPAHLGNHTGDRLGSCAATCGFTKTEAATGDLYTTPTALGDVDLVVYPNPSMAVFTFKLESSSTEEVSITIFDISGKVIVERNHISPTEKIVIDELTTPGVYIAEVKQGEFLKTVKITKVN